MPWFVDEMISGIKKIPTVVENILSSEVVYTRPQPEPIEALTPDRESQKVAARGETPILEGEWQGTNYDPLDIWQNRPDATAENIGKGAAGVKIDDTMVAVSRKKDSDEAMIRLGTVLEHPETGKRYLVADLMNERFNGMQKIDFATPKRGKEIDENYNKSFKGFKIIREGQGYEDVRDFVESGEWDKIKK